MRPDISVTRTHVVAPTEGRCDVCREQREHVTTAHHFHVQATGVDPGAEDPRERSPFLVELEVVLYTTSNVCCRRCARRLLGEIGQDPES